MQGGIATPGRKRAAVELIAREGDALRKTARRYSLCADDAEDAYQRALEILLLKAPSEDQRELIRWTTTVVKHEALAVKRDRERLLGSGARPEGDEDPIARLAADAAGPGERVERREQIARSREAMRSLKPAELRALTLLAAGYSYLEIGRITGFSQTKVNRCLAEGRARLRAHLARAEDGSRCTELAPLLSAYCDGEAGAADAVAVREHLRACAPCRATMREYRAAPITVAALAPALFAPRSLVERAHDFLGGLYSKLPGTAAGDSGLAQVAAAGGPRGAGMAALAKAMAVCAGTVGGAACVATGVAPVPLELAPDRAAEARIERVAQRAEGAPAQVEYEPAPEVAGPEPEPSPSQPPPEPEPEPEAGAVEAESAAAGAVEYVPPPSPEPSPPPATSSSGSAAGEFGP